MAGVVAALVVLGGCGDSPTELEMESITEVTFAPELGVDLADFTELSNGVYVKDAPEGDGEPVTYGTEPTITFTAWLADGTVVAEGTTDFIMGVFRLPVGFEEGMLNARVGGTRWLLVPPNKGLGGVEQVHELGTTPVPGGSVLVYEVVVDGLAG
jgi:FKBP-type peptidyl-prolyl cis-trans isomerase